MSSEMVIVNVNILSLRKRGNITNPGLLKLNSTPELECLNLININSSFISMYCRNRKVELIFILRDTQGHYN